MAREIVASSNLNWIDYNEDKLTLDVGFHNGRSYRYFGVPKQAYSELISAQSIGRYFITNIRSNYNYEAI